MAQHYVKIKSVHRFTHDVLKVVTEKPEQFNFTPGQATEVAINKNGWQNERKPFTITNLPRHDYLEFAIKTYPSRKNVTNEFLNLEKNDELILHDVFGAIEYKAEGVFIAGGAGVTPFISIFRYLKSKNELGNNKLIYANKTKNDIIFKYELNNILGKNCINILSNEKAHGYSHGYITEDFLKEHITDFRKNIYVCGPQPMMINIKKFLSKLHINENLIIKEES